MAPFPLVRDWKKHLTSEALFQWLRYEEFPEAQEQENKRKWSWWSTRSD